MEPSVSVELGSDAFAEVVLTWRSCVVGLSFGIGPNSFWVGVASSLLSRVGDGVRSMV